MVAHHSRYLQQPIRKGGFSVVYMSYNAEVSYMIHFQFPEQLVNSLAPEPAKPQSHCGIKV
jgi:predicted Ser/Thr protein kinase